MTASASMDPFQQSFTLQDGTGTPFNVTIPELDEYISYGITTCIAYGTQIGACSILLVVLLLLTKPEKRSSPIFIVNSLALCFGIIRTVLASLYFTSPFWKAYAFFAQDFSKVHATNYAQSVTGSLISVLMLVCVEISLCIQTQVVCITLRELYQRAIFATSILVALLAIGFHFAYMVENCILIIQAKPELSIWWLGSATNITLTISICWSCAIFVTKLGFVLRQRKKLGMSQFGPMQIIFIMGLQTLIVPVVFSIIQYWVLAGMGSFTLASVALFLPLSSLWASASLDGRFRQSKDNNFSPQMVGSNAIGSAGRMMQTDNFTGPLSLANTSATRIGSGVPSPRHDDQHQFCRDLEAQGLAGTGGFARKELE